ncbi:MAG TPA: hydrogenase, partial [Candidatus Krumholzibacteria bacterium]|nr:hydrogenase [Candidatus Krumholzibacteria bacterium]
PPFFVAGAVFAGFAMVVTLGVPLRQLFGLQDFITEKHLDNMGKVMLATGMIVVYGYAAEIFFAWYSKNPFDIYMVLNRIEGPYRYVWFALILCNAVAIQALWWTKVRTSVVGIMIVSMFVNVGMWLERFIIVITSLHRDFMPSSWDMYYPTRWDWAIFIGSLGLFLTLMLVFIRVLPSISIFEIRMLLPGAKGGEK